jgi:hypothetical protein
MPRSATTPEPQSLPGWGWLLIVSGLLVFLVLLPLAIYIHRRSEQEQKEDAELLTMNNMNNTAEIPEISLTNVNSSNLSFDF